MTEIIDGKSIATGIKHNLKLRLKEELKGYRPPYLAVVLVGQDPASHIYVNYKEKACRFIGMETKTHFLPEKTSESNLLQLIQKLNEDEHIDGILIQLPLPAHINKFRILNTINPIKDVDGLGMINQGRLALNLPCLAPCTPLGVVHLLESTVKDLEGKLVAVVGRSILVGSPLARLLTHKNCTVIHIHSKTVSPEALCASADIVVSAAGVEKLLNADWIKEGATVIDVGIHRSKHGLCGDVDFESVMGKASYVTPVPGGVGPMTIAKLLSNCVQAYDWQKSKDSPFT